MVQAPSLTLQSFLTQPETEPAQEYIDGKLSQKPMPKGEHSRLQQKLLAALNRYLEDSKTALALPELRCTFGGRSIVPDIAVFTWQNLPKTPDGKIANEIETPPDWIIEILSPKQSSIQVTDKILHAIQQGTQIGWLIDPTEAIILVYFSDQRPQSMSLSESPIPVPKFAETVMLSPSKIFGWLTLN
jgi:Uma2 family endonuclease